VVTHERAFVTSKAQAVEAIRRVEKGERAHLVEQIYRLCRVKGGVCSRGPGWSFVAAAALRTVPRAWERDPSALLL